MLIYITEMAANGSASIFERTFGVDADIGLSSSVTLARKPIDFVLA